MLLPPATTYLPASITTDEVERHALLIESICAKAGVPVVTTALAVSYNDIASHTSVRTSLVLEESLHAISQALETIWKNEHSNLRRGSMVLQMQAVEQHSKLIRKVTFHNPRRSFTKAELFSIRPGTVVQLISAQCTKLSQAVLGVITGGSNREMMMEQAQTLTVSCYGPLPQSILVETDAAGRPTEWNVTVLATLVAECRAFEALTCTLPQQQHLPFLHTLVSGRLAQRTRFDSDGNEVLSSQQDQSDDIPLVLDEKENPHFILHPLNRKQEQAASSFLQAKPGTITLIQVRTFMVYHHIVQEPSFTIHPHRP